ncbi:hypothetical protein ABZ646_44295, partial [Streptomyces sp. NPDC007162]|uniref:hypothetical protein n=1 Tax=Streptomyces sp. NPDC007162 TaxID=3156917 RepID=UPI0033E28969
MPALSCHIWTSTSAGSWPGSVSRQEAIIRPTPSASNGASRKAGQVIARSPEPIFSYDKCVGMVENLAKALET